MKKAHDPLPKENEKEEYGGVWQVPANLAQTYTVAAADHTW
jgi:hypothetical protein